MSQPYLARFAAGLLFLFLSAIAPIPVLASQSPPQVQLSVAQASPGATIEVIGGHFPEDAMVELAMRNAEKQITFGTFLADDHGEFTIPILLPLDLQHGEYEFLVTDERNQVAAAPLTIIPDPQSQEAGDLREDSDGLVAPMPTLAPGADSTPLPQTTTSDAQAPQPNTARLMYPILFGVVLLILLGLRILKNR